MSIPFLDLKRQYAGIQEEVESAAIEVMRSGAYIGGKYVADFEKAAANYLGVKHAIGCSNGTDALVLALRACNVLPGDEVITSAFTFFATAEAIASIGAIPVFCDVDERDFNINHHLIEEKITPKTKAIMPVHIFGNPCDMDAVMAIAKKHNIKVIEDAAQAIGSEYNGKKIGTIGDITSFSFYPTKNLGAFGDAGMITTNDDDLKTILLALREHGMAKNGSVARELLYGIKDEFKNQSTEDALYNPYKYYNYIIAYNARLDAIQAAILTVKLKYLDTYNETRAKIAAMYTKELEGVVIIPQCVHGSGCNHQYAIRVNQKDEMMAFLSEKGVATGAFYPIPLHLQKAFDYLGYKENSLPVSEKIAKETICLPIFPGLTDEEIKTIIQAIKDFS